MVFGRIVAGLGTNFVFVFLQAIGMRSDLTPLKQESLVQRQTAVVLLLQVRSHIQLD